MAVSYKDIIITPYRSDSTYDPKIEWRGANTSVNVAITTYMYPTSNGTLSFEGSAGQLFSITNDMTGSIYSVNDVSGIPSIDVNADGTVAITPYSGNIAVGRTSAAYKVDVVGTVNASSILVNGVAVLGVPINNQTSAYAAAASDVGKTISITTGGVTINASIFNAGDTFVIYNNSASSQTITQGGSVTMYLSGTATTGNRTLAQRGICTVLCVAANVFVISGGGLS